MIKHTWNQLTEHTKNNMSEAFTGARYGGKVHKPETKPKKFTKGDFSKLSKEEIELLSMGASMFINGGPVIDPKNIHFITQQGLRDVIKGMEKEQRNLAPEGKKLFKSILKKTKPLVEQFGINPEEDEEEKAREIARQVKSQMSQQLPPEVGDELETGEVRPLETGQPGALSTDIGWKQLAKMAKPQEQQPQQGQRPPMGQPPMGMGQPQQPERPHPSIDDQPSLPVKPMGQQPPQGQPPMGMGQQPPKETEGPRSMEPAPEFADRMKIKPHQRHHVRPEEDDMPVGPPQEQGMGGPPPGPGVPGGQQPKSDSPQEGQAIRPELAQDPAAPKEMPAQKAPGTTEASQDFLDKYAGAIKSRLKQILDQEREKFSTGRDLNAMAKAPMQESYCYTCEQASNAVGTGMSPVVGNEGGIEGRDKKLGSTADEENFDLVRRASKAINVMSQKTIDF